MNTSSWVRVPWEMLSAHLVARSRRWNFSCNLLEPSRANRMPSARRPSKQSTLGMLKGLASHPEVIGKEDKGALERGCRKGLPWASNTQSITQEKHFSSASARSSAYKKVSSCHLFPCHSVSLLTHAKSLSDLSPHQPIPNQWRCPHQQIST